MKIRGFEVVDDSFRAHPDMEVVLPSRKTTASAGYDLRAVKGGMIPAGEVRMFMTEIKAYMPENELFIMNVRSSIGFKKKLRLINTQGWIDSDFYGNPENDGNIGVALYNPTNLPVKIDDGERIAQGIFIEYRIKDNDDQDPKEDRVGGVGSTGKF